jgi:hypothetical protein
LKARTRRIGRVSAIFLPPEALCPIVTVQREIAGPNIDADQLSLIPMTSMIACPVKQSGANSQPGEPSRYNEAAEINSRIVKISCDPTPVDSL